MIRIATLLLLTATLTLGCETDAPPPAEPGTEATDAVGTSAPASLRPAPDFALPTLAGDTLRLADLEGRVAVVNFWATWCAPCVEEMPDLSALHERLDEQGLTVVGISLDYDDPDVVARFAEDLDVAYPLALDPEGTTADAFGGVLALPTTFVIDRQGRIVHRIMGIVPFDEIEPLLTDLLTT